MKRADLFKVFFLDAEEEARVRTQVDADMSWFETVKKRRTKAAKPEHR